MYRRIVYTVQQPPFQPKHTSPPGPDQTTLIIILPFPLLYLPPIIHPIQPTPIINTHPFGVIPSLQRQLRRSPSPDPSLAVEHHIPRLPFLDTGFGEAKARLEFLGGEEEGVGLGGERDGDGGGDYARGGEFGGFADVDEDGFLGWGGGVGGEGGVYLCFVYKS